jgi:2-polyprenyl-3-methyl-5-hydroxy-6-metoxy-1,4-benzoquinol methylase
MDLKLHKQHQQVQESHWWFRVKDNILKDLAKKYFKYGASILDFGCNYGHLVRLLQSSGYDSYGFDISEKAINYGRSLGINNIFLESEKSLMPASFDALVALDVLEHLEDDGKILNYFSSIVRSGGVVIMTVPAFGFLWGVQDVISHHFRRYTLKKLLHLVESDGNFKILKKSYFNTLLFVPIALVRIFTRVFVKNPRYSDLDMNGNFLNKIFFHIFDFERKILRYVSFPFGVSILLVLKKNDN